MSDDWAWPALIHSLQSDIVRLHEIVESMRRDTASARELHREELDGLIDQLRQVRTELDPILSEREAAQKAKREVLWDWIGKGGWVVLTGVAIAVYHFLTKHMGIEHE